MAGEGTAVSDSVVQKSLSGTAPSRDLEQQKDPAVERTRGQGAPGRGRCKGPEVETNSGNLKNRQKKARAWLESPGEGGRGRGERSGADKAEKQGEPRTVSRVARRSLLLTRFSNNNKKAVADSSAGTGIHKSPEHLEAKKC